MSSGIRGPNDQKWKDVKEVVFKRDNYQDRILKVITYKEYLLLKKNAGSLLNILDPAHYRAVSELPEEIYNPNNIIALNRFSHSNLDSFRDPIDGHNISKEEVNNWWIRILKGNKKQYQELVDKGLINERE